MNILMRFAMAKMAAEELKYRVQVPTPYGQPPAIQKNISKLVKRLGEGRVTKRELGRIKKQIRKIKPKTEKEKKVEQIAGRKWTKGQYKRYAAIGAGAGMATRITSRAIEGAGPWFKRVKGRGALKPVFSPRGMAAAAAIGGIYGAAMPAAKRLIDIEAAKKGKF